MIVPRWQRAFVIATCALIGAAFAYAACDWGHWPRLTYMPVRGEWAMRAASGAVSMTYLGIVAWGVGGAAVGALAGAAVCAVARKPLPDRLLLLLGAWAVTAILLVGGYFTWSLWPW
jgi:hypothetical protein